MEKITQALRLLGDKTRLRILRRIENLSIPSESIDFALFSQALHHLPDPQQGITQAVRILRPQGRLVIMELASHEEEWVKDKLGHRWLGFEPITLETMMRKMDLTTITVETNPLCWGESFRVILASGIKN